MNLPIIKLCFLSEEKLFSLITDFNKTILAAFITRLARHPEKNKTEQRTVMYCFPEHSKFFETPCIDQKSSKNYMLIPKADIFPN